MSFRFPLETLLRFRRSVETRAETLLIAANQKVAEAQQQIRALHELGETRAQRIRGTLGVGLYGIQLQFEEACRENRERQLAVLAEELTRLQRLQGVLRERFLQARRERLALEQLREQARQSYLRHEARAEQRRLDELLLLRREFQRRG